MEYIQPFQAPPQGSQAEKKEWQISRHICALSDGERHLGHAVKTDQWHAYNATRPNETFTGFQYLGAFEEASDARQAIEASLSREKSVKTFRAGSNGTSFWET